MRTCRRAATGDSLVTWRGLLATGGGAALLWVLATEPWGMRAYQLVVFTAPGALLGLGAGWMSCASAPETWTWSRARAWALGGAAVLPPFLAFLVALDGQARPHQLLAGFVRAAWLALCLGLAIAVARAARAPLQHAGQDAGGELEDPLAPRTPREVGQEHLARVPQVALEGTVERPGHRGVVDDQRELIVERH